LKLFFGKTDLRGASMLAPVDLTWLIGIFEVDLLYLSMSFYEFDSPFEGFF
jgi:hypothetical protein